LATKLQLGPIKVNLMMITKNNRVIHSNFYISHRGDDDYYAIYFISPINDEK